MTIDRLRSHGPRALSVTSAILLGAALSALSACAAGSPVSADTDSPAQAATGETSAPSPAPTVTVTVTATPSSTEAPALTPTPPASPEPRYVVYSNVRFGYAIEHPASFIPGGEADNGDGQVFWSPDGAGSLRVWGSYNIEEHSPKSYLTELIEGESAGEVTYDHVRSTAVTISGYTEGGLIFYTRAFVLPRSIQVMRWEYPRSEKAAYDEFVERSVESFTPGEPS